MPVAAERKRSAYFGKLADYPAGETALNLWLEQRTNCSPAGSLDPTEILEVSGQDGGRAEWIG
jgi:hypothetical protein